MKRILKKGVKIIGKTLVVLLALYGVILLSNHYNEQKEDQITIEYQGEGNASFRRTSWDVDESVLVYYETMEEALQKTRSQIFAEKPYMRRMDSEVKRMENDTYGMLFYTSIYDEEKAALMATKFKIKEENGTKLYALTDIQPLEQKKKYLKRLGTVTEAVTGGLKLTDFESVNGIDPEKRFVWSYSDSKKIYTLEIEGQKPTEIIPYMLLGKKEYLWYYENLESTKPGTKLDVYVEE